LAAEEREMSFTVKILEERELYRGRFALSHIRAEVRDPKGVVFEVNHEVYRHGFAAAVLLYDPDRRVVMLVRQFRMAPYLADGTTEMLEACAGMLDGDAPSEGAWREVMEETGVEARELAHAFDAFMSPGGMTERISCFTARYTPEDRKSAGGGVDVDEHIEVVEIVFEDALRLIADGGIRDAKTIALLYHARATGLM
jgi:nudix-type nucleoside diphosphatase (YffH/AdpP family)